MATKRTNEGLWIFDTPEDAAEFARATEEKHARESQAEQQRRREMLDLQNAAPRIISHECHRAETREQLLAIAEAAASERMPSNSKAAVNRYLVLLRKLLN